MKSGPCLVRWQTSMTATSDGLHSEAFVLVMPISTSEWQTVDWMTSGARIVPTLDEDTFAASVYPILQSTCAGCHQARGSDNKPTGATSFTDNRFVLTGDPEGDWGVTMTMVSDTCHPPVDYLLARPSTIPHPDAATSQTTAVLPANSANYATIASWIAAGCLTP